MSLLDRLAHARALDRLGAGRRGDPDRVGSSPASPRVAGGLGRITPTRPVTPFLRDERSLPLEPAAGCVGEGRARRFGERRELRERLLGGCLATLRLPSGPALARDLVCLGAAGTRAAQPVFLDTETTGLAGAAVAFVIGLAWIDGPRLRCVQWTLAQCSGEAELLADVLAQLDALGPAPLVTYNGASFDLPLLRVRAQRHGLAARALDAEHVDLLHPARRLFGRRGGSAGPRAGRAGDCKLATLERRLLGVERRGDIDSAAIPDVFWDWVQAPADPGAQRRLAAVCDHNLADLASLPALAAKLAATVRAPDDLDRALRAARHLERIGAGEQARLVLARSVESERARSTSAWRAATLELATLERRAGERQRAADLWRAAYLADPSCPDACEAWAKHLEHGLGELGEALRVARGSREPCPRRIARLEARLAARLADRAANTGAGAGTPVASAESRARPIPTTAPVCQDERRLVPAPGPFGAARSAHPGAGPGPKRDSRELLTRDPLTDAGVVRYRLLR